MCPLIINALLREVIQLRISTYAEIEQRTSSFVYGFYDLTNRPSPVKKQQLQYSNIAGSASQKLCFFKLFPIIFNDIVDRLPSFIVYKVLREILDLILSYPFRRKWLHVLGELFDTFHETMLSHFPDKITPKAHVIREYKYMINDFGPAVRQWCFRYEANHLYF